MVTKTLSYKFIGPYSRARPVKLTITARVVTERYNNKLFIQCIKEVIFCLKLGWSVMQDDFKD